MSEVGRHIRASPERVFAVLADPSAYGKWVVGSDVIRDADADWPAVGSRFHHRVGMGPLKVNDHTEVVTIHPGRRLVLRARARPLGTAVVELSLAPRLGGTWVTMREVAGDPLTRLVFNSITDWLVDRRNREALRRLAHLAESAP